MSKFKYALSVEFDGSDYCGWQSQADAQEEASKPAIQSVISNALNMILREEIPYLQGCGRTDAGVHAKCFVMHFETDIQIQEPNRVRLGVDAVLPESISALKLIAVADDFHALSSLKEKTYEYRVLLRRGKDSLGIKRRWWIPMDSEPSTEEFDFVKLEKALMELKGSHDFLSFASSGYCAQSTTRTISNIYLKKNNVGLDPEQGVELVFLFSGDGFLKHQIRNMVGTAIRIAQHKLPSNFISSLLNNPVLPAKRERGMHCAPAYGLSLKELFYD